jgi:hypothetical protein
MIDDFRRELSARQQRGSALVTGTVWTFAAVAVGALIVVGWSRLPLPRLTALIGAGGPTKTAGPAFASSAKRLGRAEAALVLPVYLNSVRELAGISQMVDPGYAYRLLHNTGAASRMAQAMGRNIDDEAVGGMWIILADCILDQPGRTFCHADNRVLAVEAVGHLVRFSSKLETPPRPNSFASAMAAVNGDDGGRARAEVRAIKDRSLTRLRTLLQDGRLVASDFGSFTGGDFRALLQEVKPTRNACADEGLGG